MELTATRSIAFFGWWDQPRTVLAWDDVKARCLSWRKLRDQYHFSAAELQGLQPCKVEWINRGALTLHDLHEMAAFPINPITDMHANLAEVWAMHWTPEQMVAMGMTFAQMKGCGLNCKIMTHFGFSLSAWTQLGLSAEHVLAMSEDEARVIFGLPAAERIITLSASQRNIERHRFVHSRASRSVRSQSSRRSSMSAAETEFRATEVTA